MISNSHNNKLRSLFATVAILSLLAVSCAKQGYPSGGPRDVTPPQVLSTLPDNASTRFSNNGFYIQFDEYVVLKDADNNVLVSPPMSPKPEYRTKGKGVEVKFKDTLQANTTYIFQFKEAIADFNEGNLLPSFEYVLSTGGSLDNLTIRGSVADAQLKKAPMTEGFITVLLCDDTLGVLYQTRCDKEGNFAFNYIKLRNYTLIALKDENKNLRIDNAESVAFLDETVTPWDMPPLNDTTYRPDSTLYKQLLLSTPFSAKQRITSNGFIKKSIARITTLLPLTDPEIQLLSGKVAWSLNAHRDTITLWPLSESCDSLSLILKDPSFSNSENKPDTLQMKFRSRSRVAPRLIATPNFRNQHPYYDTLKFRFDYPIVPDQESLRCVTVLSSDSLDRDTIALMPLADHPNILYTEWKPQPGKQYTIQMRHQSVADIYGHKADSARWDVKISKPEDYGTLRLNLTQGGGQPYFLELLNEKGDVVATQPASSVVEFIHLKPGKYNLRLFLDSNGDGRWTPVDFSRRRQPEKVLLYPKTLTVRENWEFEETWDIEQ